MLNGSRGIGLSTSSGSLGSTLGELDVDIVLGADTLDVLASLTNNVAVVLRGDSDSLGDLGLLLDTRKRNNRTEDQHRCWISQVTGKHASKQHT